MSEKNMIGKRERPTRDFLKLSVRKKDRALEIAEKISQVIDWNITRIIEDAELGHTVVFLNPKVGAE